MTSPSCPLCGSNRATEVYRASVALPNLSIADYPLALGACAVCGFVFQTSAYAPGYDELMQKTYAGFDVNRVFPFPERSAKNLEPLDMLLRHLPPDRPLSVLEIGSNRGDLLYLLREKRPRYNVLGLEPSQFSDLSVPTIHGMFRPGLFSSRFDVVIMKHVLEHLKDPRGCISTIETLVPEGGILYIEVPDLDLSLDYRVEDFIPDHVGYYTRHTLSRLLEAGFSQIDCERRTFLRLLLRRRSGSSAVVAERVGAESPMEKFTAFSVAKHDGMSNIRSHAEAGRRVIFYGVSYYFSRLFQELSGTCSLVKARFIDDNMVEEYEPTFGLRRAEASSAQANDLIVLCSNNFKAQEAMLMKLVSSGCSAAVMLPWRGMYQSAGTACAALTLEATLQT